MKRCITVPLICLAGAMPALADTFVLPLGYEHSPGTSVFLGPLASPARTNQMLIHENQLTSLVGWDLMGIAFRLPPSANTAWPVTQITITDYDLYLSPSVPPANRSFTFAENVAGPQVQVRSGSLVIPVGAYTFGGSPNAFGPVIEFDQGYTYDGGHLLIELRQTGTGTNRSVDAIGTSTPGYGTEFSTAWASGHTATTGGMQGNFVVFQLTVVPSDPPCYPDCDSNGELNINDFLCFIDEFAIAQGLPTAQQITHYANCDGRTSEPVLSVNDFLCFIDEFAAGCP